MKKQLTIIFFLFSLFNLFVSQSALAAEETREVTFNGSYTFVLGTFNAIDYIEGNDEKGGELRVA